MATIELELSNQVKNLMYVTLNSFGAKLQLNLLSSLIIVEIYSMFIMKDGIENMMNISILIRIELHHLESILPEEIFQYIE